MNISCDVPIGWTIGEACAALCECATVLGQEERARFNWVTLVARPGDAPDALARAYWTAIVAREDRVVTVPTLSRFNAVMARRADRAANIERDRLIGKRG